jgi:hypothetical protein
MAAAIILTIASATYFSRIKSVHLSRQVREQLKETPFCEAGAQFEVPPELVAGVVSAEELLNRTVIDSAQDIIFQALVDSHDENWWDRWRADAMKLADKAQETHLVSNKWPAHVVATGIVFSIGPAQITPRTAMRACAYLKEKPSLCRNGTRALISKMLDKSGATEMAALVLRFEKEAHMADAGINLADDMARWATIYNFGGDYYRHNFKRSFPINSFGRWVASNADEIRDSLSCFEGGRF